MTTLTKTSVHAVPLNHIEIEYGGKDSCISDELYLHFCRMHMKMIRMVKVTMTMMVIAIIVLTVLSCSSLIDGNGGSIKVCCSVVVHGWATASVL